MGIPPYNPPSKTPTGIDECRCQPPLFVIEHEQRANYYGLATGKVNRSRLGRAGERIRPVLPSIPDASLTVAERHTLFYHFLIIYLIYLLFIYLILFQRIFTLFIQELHSFWRQGTMEKYLLTY